MDTLTFGYIALPLIMTSLMLFFMWDSSREEKKHRKNRD